MAKDLFSNQASHYVKFRPLYPEALYEYIYRHVDCFDHAWDCGTGNGQVAKILATQFKEVYASDISANQIALADPCDNIVYRVEAGEECSATPNSFDLITVAQAIHWFDFEKFYEQVRRVLKPGGILAVWAYENVRINEDLDLGIQFLYKEVLGPYWDPERAYIEDQLRSIPFPYPKIPAPVFNMGAQWTYEQLLGYLGTWSAWQNYYQVSDAIKTKERLPMVKFRENYRKHWKEGEIKQVWFPVYLLMGRKI